VGTLEEDTLILTALATGATAGALDALKDDVKDKAKAAYAKLHDLVRHRFRDNPSAEIILSEHPPGEFGAQQRGASAGRLAGVCEHDDGQEQAEYVEDWFLLPGSGPVQSRLLMP
jgi:hypothetical protein